MVAGGLVLSGCGGDDDTTAEPPAASPTVLATASSTPNAVPSSTPDAGSADNAQLLAEIVEKVDETAPGFAQIVQNIPKRKLAIYWKGAPPAEVKALEGTSGTGVEVTIVAAKLSKADTDAAIRRIAQAAGAGKVPNPDSISVNKDYSGLVIGFSEAHYAANNTSANRAKYEEAAKVPVTIGRAGEHAPD